MEDKINVAEILRDMPKGTKLYSSILGDVEFEKVSDDDYRYPIIVTENNSGSDNEQYFTENGMFLYGYTTAEAALFPSRDMRDWTKFFKRGDVVRSTTADITAIFEDWSKLGHTSFETTICKAKYIAIEGDVWTERESLVTEYFVKVKGELRDKFIAEAEKHFNGKYNPDTLQVEPVKPVKPKCPFKPFDKVLVRNEDEAK